MEEKLNQIRDSYLAKIAQVSTLKALDGIFLALFGKNGEITLLPKKFSKLPKEELKEIGPLFNIVKHELEITIEKKRDHIREQEYAKLANERANLVETEITPRRGHVHPLTQLEQQIVALFEKLGFQQYATRHIDTDTYNFELLNIPKGHPARDLWDTLYVEDKDQKFNPGELLLRTHTSNSQVRIMREFKEPIRMMVLDRCFRYENLDPRHEHTFDQFEAVLVGKGSSMANLQYLSEYFLKEIFGQEIKVRMVPKYFPFVEPGAAVEGECIFCKGKGCKVCGKGWLELAGAGMIAPQVLKNGGFDPDEYSGIAWGFGPDRIALLKYGVSDIRTWRSGDLRQLEKIYASK